MIVLLLSWSLYFFLHSWLAAVGPKNWFRKKFHNVPFRYYRVGYNLISGIGLVLLLVFQFIATSKQLFIPSAITTTLGVVLLCAGILIMLIAGINYDLKSFFGLIEERKDTLKLNRLNRFVRHPLYSGTTLFFLSICIIWPYYKNLLLLIIYILYIHIGMFYEEKKLVQQYGDDYLQYRSKVKKIIPGIW